MGFAVDRAEQARLFMTLPKLNRWSERVYTPSGLAKRLEKSCRIWKRSKVRGYGQLNVPDAAGKVIEKYVHRIAFRVYHGAIPDGMDVHHLCENTDCWEPSHLALKVKGPHQAEHNRERAKRKRMPRVLNVRMERDDDGEMRKVTRFAGSRRPRGESRTTARASRAIRL